AELFRRMVSCAHLFFFNSKCFQPVKAVLLPVCMPLKIRSRLAEEFQLHLLKLSGTENKVTRCDLISERFSDLADTERNFLSGCTLHVFEVHKDTLGCLRAQINSILCIFRYALECLEHKVE